MTEFIPSAERTAYAAEIMPYAGFIGLQCGQDLSGSLYALPYRRSNIGNVFLPALHGGLIGGFAESCATLFLMYQTGLRHPPKIIDFSMDYLRSGQAETLYARCTLTRKGRRIAHVAVSAWQTGEDKPVVLARCHFQMPSPTETETAD